MQNLRVQKYSSHLRPIICGIALAVLGAGFHGELIRAAANEKHDKQVLRIAALHSLEDEGLVDSVYNTFMKTLIKLNFKKHEWAKPGKNGRVVCDLSTPASIRGGWLCSLMKDAWSETRLRGARGELQFVLSPNRDVLRDVFRRMLTDDIFVFHSDDSCLTLRCLDGMFRCNLDISSCDSSNGPAIFQLLRHLCPLEYDNIISDLLDQCRQAAVLGVGPTKFTFKPNWYYEYSGTTLTTLLNNLANTIIGLQLLECPFGTIEDTKLWVEARLGVCGWLCTIQTCEYFEDLQFLKNSPVHTVDGEVETMLNLGVILRALGQKSGDLMHPKLTFGQQSVLFNSALTKGFVHAGTHCVTKTLRSKYQADVEAIHTNATIRITGSDVGEIADYSICRRYRITQSQLDDLVSTIETAGPGDTINDIAARAMLKLDYGL